MVKMPIGRLKEQVVLHARYGDIKTAVQMAQAGKGFPAPPTLLIEAMKAVAAEIVPSEEFDKPPPRFIPYRPPFPANDPIIRACNEELPDVKWEPKPKSAPEPCLSAATIEKLLPRAITPLPAKNATPEPKKN
ncbi:MAG: hypothetical protein K8T89_03890 [Planctomycetes bacterium]|nr:hypothetical protein [Planctomycetota bacterium]